MLKCLVFFKLRGENKDSPREGQERRVGCCKVDVKCNPWFELHILFIENSGSPSQNNDSFCFMTDHNLISSLEINGGCSPLGAWRFLIANSTNKPTSKRPIRGTLRVSILERCRGMILNRRVEGSNTGLVPMTCG